ncbi:MAG TPA: hypothetical protein VMW37_03735 [Dehalococcoidales bacterium]|nr:hypothetical protein [Dehalococcoidales bacterium]
MIRLLKQIVSSEKGQALPIVLALLVLGGLTIASGLGYTATSLKSSRLLEEDVRGIYAADAGMEDALWSLANGWLPDPPLRETINQMLVLRQIENKGTYTLYLGELIEPGEHSDYLEVDGEIVWDEEAEAYKYTVTVTWQPDSGIPVIHLEEIGARLPLDYSYQPWSAASFEENLSTDEPDETLDALGAYLLNWELGPPSPSVSENETVRTQTFYILGEGSQEGNYAWAVANRDDIGAAGEITGTSYKITTTAKRPENGETTAKIVADVMIDEGTAHILAWHISN